MTKLRLVRHPAADPAWNMAVDEALLVHGDGPLLRLYAWEPFGLSLGHFQPELDAAEREAFEAEGIRIVRRLTGGGAILHAHEITYSLSGWDGEGPFAGDVSASYRIVHEAIAAVLAELGLQAGEPEAAPRALRRAEQPFLCFARSTAMDLVCAGEKIVGSAKRRRGGRALQHGSIVLRGHPRGGSGHGIEDLLGGPVDAEALGRRFVEVLAASLGLEVREGPLPDAVLAALPS